jgi:hypothetical protein
MELLQLVEQCPLRGQQLQARLYQDRFILLYKKMMNKENFYCSVVDDEITASANRGSSGITAAATDMALLTKVLR